MNKENAIADLKSKGDDDKVAEGRVQKRKRYDAKPERSNRREERRELMAKAKSLWEALRPKATGKEKSQKLVSELLSILGGRIVEFVFRHDGSRIVQWMLAEGTQQNRAAVLDELEQGAKRDTLPGEPPFFVRLASDRYGKHLAIKLLRVGDRARRTATYERYLRGNVPALMRTSPGADALDVAFQTVVSASQRANLVLELLFTREQRLLDNARSILAGDKERKAGAPKFTEYLDKLVPEFRKQALTSAGATLSAFTDKDAMLRMNIVHCGLQQYLEAVSRQDDPAPARDIAALLAPVIVHLTHTRAGAHVAITCIKLLDAKHRKKAVRSLKGHVRKIAEDEFGHRVLLAFLEWMDDTKIVGSIIFTEILSTSKIAVQLSGEDDGEKEKKSGTGAPEVIDVDYLTALCKHKHARMIILHLLVHRQTRYFNPDVYGHLWADIDHEKFGKMSKKDPNARREELLVKVRDALKKMFASQTQVLLSHHFSAPVVIGALQDGLLCESVTLAIQEILKDGERRSQMQKNTCCRKTLATLCKIGGAEVADKVRL